jgi:hypothetical protein
METDGKNKPADHVQVGNVRIAIWRNATANGERYSAGAPEPSYKDGEEWKTSTSYSMTDLLHLSEAAREASARIRELSRNRGAARAA